MIRNFFTTALRNLTRNKTYAFINISGLAVGIAVCLTIFLIIRFETSFDTFHAKREQIYRVVTKFSDPSGVSYSAGVPVPLPVALRQDYPQLPAVAAIFGDNNAQIQVLNEENQIVKKFKEETGVFFTEPSFFAVFDFPWLAGDPATALRDPNTAVLTKATAEKYFGSWQVAIGKTIKRNDRNILTITGVLENPPANTDFQFKVVVSYPTLSNYGSDDWGTVNSNHMCNILLPPG
jgi:putative ABC transport system permease protein